jgi:hypothetical protein
MRGLGGWKQIGKWRAGGLAGPGIPVGLHCLLALAIQRAETPRPETSICWNPPVFHSAICSKHPPFSSLREASALRSAICLAREEDCAHRGHWQSSASHQLPSGEPACYDLSFLPAVREISPPFPAGGRTIYRTVDQQP